MNLIFCHRSLFHRRIASNTSLTLDYKLEMSTALCLKLLQIALKIPDLETQFTQFSLRPKYSEADDAFLKAFGENVGVNFVLIQNRGDQTALVVAKLLHRFYENLSDVLSKKSTSTGCLCFSSGLAREKQLRLQGLLSTQDTIQTSIKGFRIASPEMPRRATTIDPNMLYSFACAQAESAEKDAIRISKKVTDLQASLIAGFDTYGQRVVYSIGPLFDPTLPNRGTSKIRYATEITTGQQRVLKKFFDIKNSGKTDFEAEVTFAEKARNLGVSTVAHIAVLRIEGAPKKDQENRHHGYIVYQEYGIRTHSDRMFRDVFSVLNFSMNAPSKKPIFSLWAKHAFSIVLTGMARCHENGLYHRDLKLENIYLKEDGTPIISDWEFATDNAHGETVLGTPALLHPEAVAHLTHGMFRGDGDASRSFKIKNSALDSWALGATLYELLTWKPLYTSISWERGVPLNGNKTPLRSPMSAAYLTSMARGKIAELRDPVENRVIKALLLENNVKKASDDASANWTLPTDVARAMLLTLGM
ncbi:hypothetical protein EBR96_06205 [bacterium]|nr:hypothetical protein [bacterium]